ncbi:hypothetical protein R3P38DRAFT_3600770 [Favolaschia claudopus]|uniref:HMG box domain-containing protein n=1 Tax=Favolaschia claudopus TaxID=2862362 RepID=A0AAW0ACE8_9AGAR
MFALAKLQNQAFKVLPIIIGPSTIASASTTAWTSTLASGSAPPIIPAAPSNKPIAAAVLPPASAHLAPSPDLTTVSPRSARHLTPPSVSHTVRPGVSPQFTTAPPSQNSFMSSNNPLDALALVAVNASAGNQFISVTPPSASFANTVNPSPSHAPQPVVPTKKKKSSGPTARALCKQEWERKNPQGTAKIFGDYWKSLDAAEKEKWKVRETQAAQALAQALGGPSA